MTRRRSRPRTWTRPVRRAGPTRRCTSPSPSARWSTSTIAGLTPPAFTRCRTRRTGWAASAWPRRGTRAAEAAAGQAPAAVYLPFISRPLSWLGERGSRNTMRFVAVVTLSACRWGRAALAAALILMPAAQAASQPAALVQCKPDGSAVAIPELPEASGVAISRRVPGRLWAHNDSGRALLVALDARGAIKGQVQIAGITIDDWEALAVGPCPAGSCLYVGDIGDNNGKRKRITVHRAAEPADGEASVSVSETFHATYPDGVHD